MKRIVLLVAAISGCGTVTTPASTADDTGDDMPDAGTRPTPDAPDAMTPPKPGDLAFVPSQTLDERGDTIQFTSGEPVHTHAGAPVMLGGAGCPALYRYAYLLDRARPFGEETAPNPLVFELDAHEAEPGSGAYRVVASDGLVLQTWTELPVADAAGHARIELHRDDIAGLGTRVGQIHIEARGRIAGAEQHVSACWEHHPMAAPLAIDAPIPAVGPNSLSARKLSPATRVTDLIVPTTVADVDVYSQRIVQQTAEPVTLQIDVAAAPVGTFSSTVVDTYRFSVSATGTKNCGSEPAFCDRSPIVDPPALIGSGPLTTGRWAMRVTDDATGATVPCPGGCTIPARPAGTPIRTFHVWLAARQITNLWTPAAMPSEITINGTIITGVYFTTIRCTDLRAVYMNGAATLTCYAWNHYFEWLALDRATLGFSPTPITFSAGIGSGARQAVAYLPNGTVTTPATTWDAGDGPM